MGKIGCSILSGILVPSGILLNTPNPLTCLELTSQITISGIRIEVTRKKVKYLRLVVNPAEGRVRISSPIHLKEEVIREFALSKKQWIKKQLNGYISKNNRPAPEYVTGETHFIWGTAYKLSLGWHHAAPEVYVNHQTNTIDMRVRPGSSGEKRKNVLKEWYRAEMKDEIPRLIEKWQKKMGVKVSDWGVRQMKTRWGSCNIRAKRIWLNLELAKKEPCCLELVVVHEMTHLLERLHNRRFYAYMDRFMPEWRNHDNVLRQSSAFHAAGKC